MPKLIVDKSLFEPIEVEIAGKNYIAQPFSARLIRGVNEINSQTQEQKIGNVEGSVRMAALIFGVSPDEFDQMDVRALAPAIEFVTEQMQSRTGAVPASVPSAAEAKIADAISEAQASKNEPKPEAASSL